jgi:hypothetical protein
MPNRMVNFHLNSVISFRDRTEMWHTHYALCKQHTNTRYCMGLGSEALQDEVQRERELEQVKVTEPISRPLLIWCAQLLSALKISGISCLCSEMPVTNSLCSVTRTEFFLCELYSCLVITDKYKRKSACIYHKQSKGELVQYFHYK